jgi:thiamine-phosphate pyrophosphorylase
VEGIDLSLYAIVDRAIEDHIPIQDFIAQIIKGGATCLQVRCKDESTRTTLEFTEAVITVAKQAGVPVIVNDRVDIALAAGAQGVHLGQDDMPIGEARRACGESLIIGASVRNVESARLAAQAGADYLGVGAVFATPVKPDLTPIPRGTIAQIRQEISLPIVAIGGIGGGISTESSH